MAEKWSGKVDFSLNTIAGYVMNGYIRYKTKADKVQLKGVVPVFQCIKNKINRFFCSHEFEKTGYDEVMENNLRFSIRHYRCRKCGKEVSVDSRIDTIMKDRIVPYCDEVIR